MIPSPRDIRPKARRRIPWVVVLGAGVVVASGAALQWREIAIRWRVAQLESQDAEADLPVDLVLAKPGTVGRDALERYVRAPAGKERLLRSYLRILERSRGEVSRHLRGVGAGGSTAMLLVWMACSSSIDGLAAPVGIEYSDFPYKQFRKISSYVEASDSVPLALQELLLEVGFEDHPLSRAGARFSIVSGPGEPESRGRVFPDAFPWGSHACLIESDPYRLDRSP